MELFLQACVCTMLLCLMVGIIYMGMVLLKLLREDFKDE